MATPGMINLGRQGMNSAITGFGRLAVDQENEQKANDAINAQKAAAEKGQAGSMAGSGAALGGLWGASASGTAALSGALGGAELGAWAGPIGALIGAGVGYLLSEVF